MRQSTDLCTLCKDKEASQKGSHIIPKFLGKGLFYGTNPRNSILWYKGGRREKVQDIIKEDFLFCPSCEKSLGVLEAYCSLRLDRLNEIRFFNDFTRFKNGDFEFVECKGINIRIFNLFIYSIVWRASSSNTFGFNGFKLALEEEEKLRLTLYEFIRPTQTDLIQGINKMVFLPEHCHVLIRPKKKLRPPSSMLSAASYNEWLHQLHLVDYLLIYLTKQDKLIDSFKRIDNNRIEGLVKIGLTNSSNWKNFNFTMIKESIQ